MVNEISKSSLTRDPHQSVRLMAVGDIMLGRGVKEYSSAQGYVYPFQHVKDTLLGSDLIFGNLELPLSSRGTPHPTKRLGFPAFRADPEAVEGLLAAGFNVLSLANNHILDYGEKALFDTIEVLRANGIYCVGAGRNVEGLFGGLREIVASSPGGRTTRYRQDGGPTEDVLELGGPLLDSCSDVERRLRDAIVAGPASAASQKRSWHSSIHRRSLTAPG